MSGKADYRDASRIEHMYAALCRVKELFAGITMLRLCRPAAKYTASRR